MQHMWVYSVSQCVLSVAVIWVSVRVCTGGGRVGCRGSSVDRCLRLCLGWAGAIGAAVGVPVSVLLDLRSPQCLYTCITLVCCPLLVRQFTMCLLVLLTLNTHLQDRLGARYGRLVTRRRALCLVLLSWVCSVVSAFAQFIVCNSLDVWNVSEGDGDTADLGLDDGHGSNWTTTVTTPRKPLYPQDRSVIGQYLPYGGFLSKFLLEDLHNFTYAEIHGSHWGVCAPDTVLSPGFLVYVYGVNVFLLPLLVLLGLHVDLMCVMPRQKRVTGQWHSLTLSLCLLVLMCLPLHTTHALRLFNPNSPRLSWASVLFQLYSLVPPLLVSHTFPQTSGEGTTLVLPLPPLAPAGAPEQGKTAGRVFCTSLQNCWPPGCPLRAKVLPKV